ncbi:MAG: hypothetical protein ACLQU3_08955 [Limisphaerales bacterium]
MIVTTQPDHHVAALLLLLRCITETVRPRPHPQPAADSFGLGSNAAEAIGELRFELLAIGGAMLALHVQVPGIKGVAVKLHAILVMKPPEKIEAMRV